MASQQASIQTDWENREFIETLTAGIKRIAEFLNNFDASTRYRLALLNEKLTVLDKSLEFLEAKVTKKREASSSV